MSCENLEKKIIINFLVQNNYMISQYYRGYEIDLNNW